MTECMEYEHKLAELALSMDGGDPDLYEDIFQEMRIALWEAPDGNKESWYLQLAKNRALNFLDWWHRRDEEGNRRELCVSELVDSSQARLNNVLYGIYEDEWD